MDKPIEVDQDTFIFSVPIINLVKVPFFFVNDCEYHPFSSPPVSRHVLVIGICEVAQWHKQRNSLRVKSEQNPRTVLIPS